MNDIKLYNGVLMPNFCFGTGIIYDYRYGKCDFYHKSKYMLRNLVSNRDKLITDLTFDKVIDTAMNCGCRMFDTSRAYGGAEYALGKALKKYDRKSYFIVTKLSNTDQYNGDVRKSLEKSLNELNMDYVDLYLIHWPVKGYYMSSWKQIEVLYEEGLCRTIGVCNCNIHHIKEFEKNVNIMPMVNQIECHPLFTQNDLRLYCKDRQIQIMAYTSTARMDERLRKTKLLPIAEKYCKSIPQIILKWHQQIGNIPIVNTTKTKHLVENLNIKDFLLNDDEVKEIAQININSRLRYDPDNCDFSQL